MSHVGGRPKGQKKSQLLFKWPLPDLHSYLFSDAEWVILKILIKIFLGWANCPFRSCLASALSSPHPWSHSHGREPNPRFRLLNDMKRAEIKIKVVFTLLIYECFFRVAQQFPCKCENGTHCVYRLCKRDVANRIYFWNL